MSIECAADLDGITLAGRVVAETLRAMENATEAGITTRDLDEIGSAVLTAHGARSAPQHVYGCPTVTLISVNDEIVHGLPGSRRVRAGDVVKPDVNRRGGGRCCGRGFHVLRELSGHGVGHLANHRDRLTLAPSR